MQRVSCCPLNPIRQTRKGPPLFRAKRCSMPICCTARMVRIPCSAILAHARQYAVEFSMPILHNVITHYSPLDSVRMPIHRPEFDSVIGQCEVTCDIPAPIPRARWHAEICIGVTRCIARQTQTRPACNRAILDLCVWAETIELRTRPMADCTIWPCEGVARRSIETLAHDVTPSRFQGPIAPQ